MKKISTIILAAGDSKRILSNKSKIFHEVADRSLIEYVYAIAEKISSKNIVIVCNRKNYHFISKKFSKAKTSLQKNAKGTADAVLQTEQKLYGKDDILILFGDVPLIQTKSVLRLIKNYKSHNKVGFLLVFKTKKPYGYGRVVTENDYIKKVIEEKDADLITRKILICNSGIMICDQNFLFDNIRKINNKNIKKEKHLTDLFEIAFKKNTPFGYVFCNEEETKGVNLREDLIKVDQILQKEIINKLIKKGVTILQPETVRISYDTKIGKDSIIEPFVVIKKGVTLKNNVIIKSHSVIEGCNIAEQTSIGPLARIRPYSKIGKNVKIGNFVEIKNSTIGNSSSISHLSYIGDSVIGQNVNIGAGTITCNYDGKKKNKTIIRNNVFIGSNTSLVAPLTIGQNSHVGAGSVITKNVPSNSLSIERTEQKNLLKKHRK